MRIHYLNCGTDCLIGGMLFDGASKGPLAKKIFCAAPLIETEEGLILFDTGYGVADDSTTRSGSASSSATRTAS